MEGRKGNGEEGGWRTTHKTLDICEEEKEKEKELYIR